MLEKVTKWGAILILGLVVSLALPSCNKDKNSQAVVFVQDEMGNPIDGASVRLYSNSGVIEVLQQTQPDGSAAFSFENEAILFIDVTADSYTTVIGEHVKLEAGELVEKIIVLQ